MRRDTTLFGLMLVLIVGGLAMVLGGEYVGMRPIVYVGGTIVLGAVGVMTLALARMDEPDGAESSH